VGADWLDKQTVPPSSSHRNQRQFKLLARSSIHIHAATLTFGSHAPQLVAVMLPPMLPLCRPAKAKKNVNEEKQEDQI
jgi:hypothetical protein